MTKLTITLLVISLCGPLFAGSFAGNGADGLNIKESAWFNMEDNVTFCVEVANDFPISETKVLALIERAREKWENYYKQRVPGSERKPKSDIINFNWVKVSQCSESTPLKFYIGANNSIVQKHKSQFTDPQAFSMALDRGKGFVWVDSAALTRPNREEKILYGLLLHEIGHIAGNSHFDHTIMRSDIAHVLKNFTQLNSFFLNIDHGNSVLICPSCNFSYKGHISPLVKNSLLLELTGIDYSTINGKFEISLEKDSGTRSELKLKIKKGSIQSILKFRYKQFLMNPFSGMAFRIYPGGGVFRRGLLSSYEVIDSFGKKRMALVSRELNSGLKIQLERNPNSTDFLPFLSALDPL